MSQPHLLPHVCVLQALERVHREQQVRDTLLQGIGIQGLEPDGVLDTALNTTLHVTKGLC